MKRRVVSVVRVSVCERVCASERARTCLFVCKCVRRGKLRTTLWSNTTIIDFISINLYIFPPAPLCFEYASGAHINISGIQRRKRHSHTITDCHLMTVTTALRKKRVNFSIYRINVSICFFPIDFAQINGFISLCHATPCHAISRIVTIFRARSRSFSCSLDLIRLQWHWIW